MALKTKVRVDVNGDALEYECYTKIAFVSGDKARIYLDIENRRFDKQAVVINCVSYSFTPSVDNDAKNFIEQGYEYLKTLTEYADATDC